MKGTKPRLVADGAALAEVPPSWLSEAAKAEWLRVMPDLVERRILTAADLGGVENYCISMGRVREIEALIQGQKQGDLFVESLKSIDPVLFRMQDKAAAAARQLARSSA